MTAISEVDALKAVDDALSKLDDPSARERVLSWAWKKFASAQGAAPPSLHGDNQKAKTRPTKKKPVGARKGKTKSKLTLSMNKDLNLKPKGKQSLDDFCGEKKPNSIYEKSTVVAYYLKHELGLAAVSANNIYTGFKHMQWRVPADLINSLAYTASRYGWLDTSNREDIKVTTMGENLVEHDLPKKSSSKKK